MGEMTQLEQELRARDVALWFAGLPPRALAAARLTPRWRELADEGRLYPTALAAARAYRHPSPPVG